MRSMISLGKHEIKMGSKLDDEYHLYQSGGELQMTSDEAPNTEFPRSIGKVATRELALSGYTRYEHLTQVSKKTLLAIHGVGPKSLNILEEELKKRGLGFKRS